MNSSQKGTEPDPKSESLWVRTPYPNLVRNSASGRLYARFRVDGKLRWKSLETDKITVAKARLPDILKAERVASERRREAQVGSMTVSEALGIVLERIQKDLNLKPRTKLNAEERCKALRRTWPALERLNIRDVTRQDCQTWAADVAGKVSPTRFNQFVRLLRWAFELAIEFGIRSDNSAASVKWVREKAKRLRLPEPQQFESLVNAVRTCGWVDGPESARFIEFLAYTGCRLSEAVNVRWEDVDFATGRLAVRGDPTTGTKNGLVRYVPLNPTAKALLETIRSDRPGEAGTATILRQKDCRKALANACQRIGIAKLTHHDLRHLFATKSIESGVDIPTVSRWLGHKDGGALAMRVYGHLRDEHSAAMAQRVSFGAPGAAKDSQEPRQQTDSDR